MGSNVNRRNVVAGVVLGLLGFAANWFRLELYFSISFLFGSFFVMLAILRYGTVAGIISGVIASLCTYFIWGHPWAAVTFSCEALFVAWRVRRRPNDIIISDLIYWVCCGVPLVWVSFHLVMGFQTQAAILILLKESINGIFNALLAMLVHLALQARRSYKDSLLSFQNVIFVAMVSLTLIPAFFMLTLHLKRYTRNEQKRLIGITRLTAQLTSKRITSWFRDRRDNTSIDQARIREIITYIGGEFNVQVTLLDGNGRVVASTRPDLATMAQFSQPAGKTTRLEGEDVNLWAPAQSRNTNSMMYWSTSWFVKEEALAPDIGWTVRVEAPLKPLFLNFNTETISAFLLMILLVVAMIGLSALISRKFVQSMHQLIDVTKALPDEFHSELSTLEWPESRVREIDDLIVNFKRMRYAIYASFDKLINLNETLEQRIKERTEDLSGSEARYRLLAENANDLIFRYRLFPEEVCLYVSPSSERLLGYAPEEFYSDVGLRYKLIHPADRVVLEQVKSGMAFPSGYQLRWMHREGRIVWLDTRLTLVSPPDSSFVEVFGISRDVTDLKLREFLAVELEEEKIKAKIMKKEKQHLREKEMLVKDLHDGIGGIVTNISMLSQYGLKQNEIRQCHEIIAKIVGLASEGATEIRSFMNSIESGDSAWSDLLAEVKGYAEKMLEPYEISFGSSVRITEGLQPIGLFRYVNIVRIYREIIANIIKHAGARTVALTFDVTAERFELSIADNGCGFYPDTVKRRGLGNMFSRAHEIGAELSVASSSGGTSIILVLPLAGQGS